MDSRGQISTLDLVVAAGIFISILLSVMWAWNSVLLKIDLFENKRRIYQKGLDVAELLVTTSGDPANWNELDVVNSNTVDVIGLVSEDNVLDQEKVNKFGEIDYDNQREILGLSKEDFNLTLYNVTDGIGDPLYSFGRYYSDITQVRISRYAYMNDEIIELRLMLFYGNSTYPTA